MQTVTEGTYVNFVSEPRGLRKTLIWSVETKNGDPLGLVQWYAGWRKYCLCPFADRVFEEVCLREIADFIVQRTREHKFAQKKAKEAAT